MNALVDDESIIIIIIYNINSSLLKQQFPRWLILFFSFFVSLRTAMKSWKKNLKHETLMKILFFVFLGSVKEIEKNVKTSLR